MTAPTGLHSPRQFDSADPSASERRQLLTAEQLAGRWQISTAQVYRLARDGAIPFVSLGRYRRFRLASIEAWEAAQEAASDV
jgi:excisionase family DNA binding protein